MFCLDEGHNIRIVQMFSLSEQFIDMVYHLK